MDDATASIVKTVVEVLLGIGGLSGLVGVLIQMRKTKSEARKTDTETDQTVPADAASTLADASGKIAEQYQKLLKDYQEQTNRDIGVLRTEVQNQRREMSTMRLTNEHYAKRVIYLMGGIQMLIQQINGKGYEPCWTPNDWKPELDRRDGDEKADPK